MNTNFDKAISFLQNYEGLWAVCGGWAIDIFLDEQTRKHKDLDVTISRRDQLKMQSYLKSNVATYLKVVSGELLQWDDDDYLERPIHNVWCSPPNLPQHYLEVMFSETNDTEFIFRKNNTIRRSIDKAFLNTNKNIRILAPEIVLLYKSRDLEREDNLADFKNCVPTLVDEQKEWLKSALIKFRGENMWLKDL